MKEKIGMEKLIELLNEREVGEEGGELYYLSNGVIRDDGGNILYDYRIISKEFGFIKWLVENDKIEGETIGNYQSRTKLRTLTRTAGLWHDAEGKSELEYIKETFTDGLLMLLSISDTTIEDLISYLK